MIILDGKAVSLKILDQVKAKVAQMDVKPHLVVILVGDNPASQIYVNNKKKAAEKVGIKSTIIEMNKSVSEAELLDTIQKLNDDKDVTGILVQLPLPKHIDKNKVILAISPKKDVDGFHPQSVGSLVIGQPGFVSCTPAGIIELLKRSNVEIEGKHCDVIGRSNIVGKPMALLMLRENATVTVCHSRTKDIKSICKQADILIVAVGKKEFVTADFVKEGAVVIDVGIHRDENNKLKGDVLFDEVKDVASYITPVPGGVGPMSIALLMNTCVEALSF